jgi:hypothetical protein
MTKRCGASRSEHIARIALASFAAATLQTELRIFQAWMHLGRQHPQIPNVPIVSFFFFLSSLTGKIWRKSSIGKRRLTKKVLSGGPGDSGASGNGSDGPPDKTSLD